VAEVERQRLTFAVRSNRGGSVLYRLVCGSGADDGNPEDFSGLIQCKLHPASGPGTSDNLFGRERRTSGRSWDNRGRFLDKEVVGGCARVPQWGATRTFDFGSFNLTLRVSDMKVDRDEKVTRYSFSVRIRPLDGRSRPAAPGPEPSWFGRPGACPL